MPPPKTRPASPFQGQPAGGWTPSRRRPALQRELSAEPPEAQQAQAAQAAKDAKDASDAHHAKDATAPSEAPATGIASHGSGSSRKI